jgi:hypothetical protein
MVEVDCVVAEWMANGQKWLDDDRRMIEGMVGGWLEEGWRMIGGWLEDGWRRVGGWFEDGWRMVERSLEDGWRMV